MFNSKTRLSTGKSAAGSTTIIGAGTTINGDIQSDGDIRIDECLNVNLLAKNKKFS